MLSVMPRDAAGGWVSTARKYSNSHGRRWPRRDVEDGDLRGWTRVDVLPPDGMQEVRSSNLLSSTRGPW